MMQDGVDVFIAGAGTRCAMVNLSPSGCLIESRHLSAEIGTPVEIMFMPGYTATGEIAWQLGESIGVFFVHPIHPNIVRHFGLDDWMLRSDWSAGNMRTET